MQTEDIWILVIEACLGFGVWDLEISTAGCGKLHLNGAQYEEIKKTPYVKYSLPRQI